MYIVGSTINNKHDEIDGNTIYKYILQTLGLKHLQLSSTKD